MKIKSPMFSAFTFLCRETNVTARLFGAAVLGVALLWSNAAQGITVTSKAANAAVYLGQSWFSLELQNPLTGNEMVLSHKVLEWRDADYSPGPPQWFGDWSASAGAGGSAGGQEIYLLGQGQSAWTTTTVPSTIVSIHLNSDNNDGLADVQVDGVSVAQFDMCTPTGYETALIIVKGLANSTHTITVNDSGWGPCGDDVHIMGAAALNESDLKWDQPPAPYQPTNVFYGWNQQSMYDYPPVAADDWVCTNSDPVTKIRWWGSFAYWQQTYPPQLPQWFLIRFWRDVAAGVDLAFSHPGVQTGPTIYANVGNYQWTYVGKDFDPRTGQYESCFLFERTLNSSEYFQQEPATGTNIYWLSIEAFFQFPTNAWGWKTRPWTNSLAPDAAVTFSPNTLYPYGASPITWPSPWPAPTNEWWDLAFELITASSGQQSAVKWLQWPDLSPNGMDVNASTNPPSGSTPYLLADDFLCTSPGLLTNITIWGSWSNDLRPQNNPSNVVFTLSIHSDIPAHSIPPWYTNHSMPGPWLWTNIFLPGQFTCTMVQTNTPEWWLTPPSNGKNPGDYACYRYDFRIPAANPFNQTGTPALPIVYWLDVQARPGYPTPASGPRFGWKTCITNWNDDAVWVNAIEKYNGPWNRLVYPPLHPRENQTVDLAFQVTGLAEAPGVERTKWSQPPVLHTVSDGFNGWDQYSVYGGTNIVADDWVCTNATPVTDVHWWGSFIGWSEMHPPQMPDGFVLSIWTDVPAGPVGGGYSHPGTNIWQILCTNFTWQFAGWDYDPRNPGTLPDACFKFDQDLTTNEFFWQDPLKGTNIYWLSVSAWYASGQIQQYPWGWKTRPRDKNSLAPDDAVRILSPTATEVGSIYSYGDPIYWPYYTNSWDMAFELTTMKVSQGTNDFGDAPDPTYPTLLVNDGARHTVVPGIFLGNLIDAEADGQPNAAATGDNLNGLADEDGVFLTSLLIPGETASVQVSASVAGFLCGWIDFNANGSWADASDLMFNNTPVNAGVNNFFFIVPQNAARGTNTYARFRFCTVAGAVTNYTGQAPDGEVEDYRWRIEDLDYGDAPDPPYPTLRASDGARHVITGLFMGARVDGEADGQPDPYALGDDNNPPLGLDDEDGVVFNTALISGAPASVTVTCSGAGRLHGWIDFNRDGSWAGERICNVPVVAGANLIKFLVPNNIATGRTYARFRLSTTNILNYTGLAPNGEVEDYAVTLYPLKWLQRPEQGPEGVDVDNWSSLADDFICYQTGPITDIHFWGSFLYDMVPVGGPGSMTITLSIMSDVPASVDGYSHPGSTLWTRTFLPGQYTVGNNWTASEWWLGPPASWIPNADTNMYQFDFYLAESNAFYQVEGTIYWLRVDHTGSSYFGWKTTPVGYAPDDACWLDTTGTWQPLFYSAPHPRSDSLDLAFALSGPGGLYDLDYGDAPSPYPTLLANDGARHFAVPNFCLGLLEDTEADGQPDPMAKGDDNNNLADEDGVKFVKPLIVNTQACVDVTLTAPAAGLLDAWVDFNGNGAWETSAGEQVFTNQLLLAGLNANLCFPVPGSAKLGTNFARFRLSSVGALLPTGLAKDGEVEDYVVTIYQPRPLSNILITNIVVTNLIANTQVVGLTWTYENNVHYRVQCAPDLGTNDGSGTHWPAWSSIGAEIIGPLHWFWETNCVLTQRFYRVIAPYIAP